MVTRRLEDPEMSEISQAQKETPDGHSHGALGIQIHRQEDEWG